MLFRQLFDHESSTYTYLIAAGYGREAVIIDPVKRNVNQYVKLIEQLGLRLVAAMDTHLHADHITALGDLNKQLHCVTMMGKQSKANCVMKRFNDEELLSFDGFELKVLYTPGHTDDSYCFLMSDRVFTGDTLFIRGTGRTDFQHGDPSMQYDSLFNRLLSLPDDTLVYPGHDYNGMTVSTIGEEKKFNPRLQVQSRHEYIDLMNALNLPNPKLMDIAVPANQKCGLVDEVT
ncbi:MBL fold metallo-hydrolase [Legionella oakridgensis]|uniref:Zn-dependent hydrolase, including glyoxylase n=2 Tax=Legionella oakridgensis TaxID=29423 RepID=W0BC05_9GAMM|nr:MBL fold metallo-hydrolase [Legionella oakridgensis]AHE67370.1 Zn-dependent hydrolase, including glyoxylase [Legionella oakridgensis ATCC 33761 = DSM 21215]ETO93031.1 Zn-dependent hydrolase, including glyoxylase [Legionella oakridgensis RV-2-2007]KTD43439.1 metallo-beta-lactamase family transporter protein [Legionella oakridgensis]STY20430.1 hydroxyacylglutathione hydrolase [Legionella longbeachae]